MPGGRAITAPLSDYLAISTYDLMANEAEYGHKLRILRIMRALIEHPNGYTKGELADRYQVSRDTIKRDIEAFRSAGFIVDCDNNHRYKFVVNQPLKQLKDLLHFSEEDQLLLSRAIDYVGENSSRAVRLKKKLASLYDYRMLGHTYLRKPYLEKFNQLQEAINEKQQVLLLNYRSSNSNVVSDRLVEPFHLNPPEDILQAYDVNRQNIRYFRMSRIMRIRFSGEPWQYEHRHMVMPADPFRIVDRQQVSVHLRLQVGAYNDLIERFPLAAAFAQPAAEENVYDFQCKVNHRFLGLTNFILGTHHQIEVLEPDSLLEHLRSEVEKIQF